MSTSEQIANLNRRLSEFEAQDIQAAATMGVRMLAAGLSAHGDPVGIRENLNARVDAWMALVKQAAAPAISRKQLKTKSQQQMRIAKKAAIPSGGFGKAAVVAAASSQVRATAAQAVVSATASEATGTRRS